MFKTSGNSFLDLMFYYGKTNKFQSTLSALLVEEKIYLLTTLEMLLDVPFPPACPERLQENPASKLSRG